MITTKLEKKQKGIFYTPETLVEILCRWSINNKEVSVLEPSFGGCGFLKETITRLSELGCIDPESQISGCDVDEGAFLYLENILPSDSKSFIKEDFLLIQPEIFTIAPFDVVIGNPPYVSYHNMNDEQRESIRTVNFKGLTLPYTSSLWDTL